MLSGFLKIGKVTYDNKEGRKSILGVLLMEVTNPPANEGDIRHVSIPGLGRYPGVGSSNHSVFLPGEFPVLYSSWGCKKLGMTE